MGGRWNGGAPLTRQRDGLHRWRGTLRGLMAYLLLYAEVKPEIVEGGSGFKLSDRKAGWDAVDVG